MIELPPPPFDQPSRYLIDILLHDGQEFKVWEDAQTFSQKKFEQLDFTDKLEQSVGCLLEKFSDSFKLLATTFVVRHLQPLSNLLIGNNRVKALLLTAAHIYSSPLSSQDLKGDIFFTLSPSLKNATLNTYSKFRVKRLLAFEPSAGEPQIDPLLGYQCMVSQDVELLAVIEGDPEHQILANGNDFFPLKFRNLGKMNQPAAGKACVVVGYPAQLDADEADLWAPIIERDQKLRETARQVACSQSGHPKRAFSRGEILLANDACVALNCSTWKGMSGSPICILSEDGKRLDYCGVYNGAAAMPFQALISKIIFRLQGKNFQFTEDDIPAIPVYNANQLLYQRPEDRDQYQIRSELLWAEMMRKLIWVFLYDHNTLTSLTMDLNISLRYFLEFAERIGFNVQHNLGVCGGSRFLKVIECVGRSERNDPNNVKILVEFDGLTRFGAIGTSPPLSEDKINENLGKFLKQAMHGKKKKFLIFTEDKYRLSFDLALESDEFTSKFENNITTVSERKVHKEFIQIQRKFSKIFEIWKTHLNDSLNG